MLKKTALLLAGVLCASAFVGSTHAEFTDRIRVDADLETVEWVTSNVHALQVSNSSSGANQVFVSWDAVEAFTEYRIEYFASADEDATARGSFTATGSQATITLPNGTWYLRISPTALTETGRSFQTKIIVGMPADAAPVRVSPACDGLAIPQFLYQCEHRGAEIVNNRVYFVGASWGGVFSQSVSAAANAAVTQDYALNSSWASGNGTPYGTRSIAGDATNLFYSVDTGGVSPSEDGIYKYVYATKAVSKVLSLDSLTQALTVFSGSSTQYLWFSTANDQGDLNQTIRYCSKDLKTCTDYMDVDEPITQMTSYGSSLWFSTTKGMYRVSATNSSDIPVQVVSYPENTATGRAWSVTSMRALSATNVVFVQGQVGDKYMYNASINADGESATTIVSNLNGAAMKSATNSASSANGLTRSGSTWFTVAAGGDNKTVDGLWRWTANPQTTPL